MRGFCLGLLLGLSAGCATPPPPAAPIPVPQKLTAATVLPQTFEQRLALEPKGSAIVPPNMVYLSTVERPRAEIRTGPGVQYELLDASVPRGSQVLVLGRYGVWRKVLLPGSWRKGWVHSQALSAPKANERALSVSMQSLPTVVVVHGVDSVQSFPAATPLKVSIPKGAQFRQLRRDERGALVWLPETNSVMWLARKDIL